MAPGSVEKHCEVCSSLYSCSIQLLTYITECKRHERPCHLRAVLVFSVIWDLKETDKILHQNSFNKHILSRFLTVRYKNIMRQ